MLEKVQCSGGEGKWEMDFRGPKPDFEDVDRRYAYLKELHAAGNITDEEFAKQRKSLMVQDQSGRWWIKSRKAGEWHYHDGSAWVKGIPPGLQSTSGFGGASANKKLTEDKVKGTEPA